MVFGFGEDKKEESSIFGGGEEDEPRFLTDFVFVVVCYTISCSMICLLYHYGAMPMSLVSV